jgi:hypothetical protein
MKDQDHEKFIKDFYFALDNMEGWVTSEPAHCKQRRLHVDGPERNIYEGVNMAPPVRFVRRNQRTLNQQVVS